MNNNEFIEINKNGWNDLIKANKPFSNTILPEYGPFLKRNEDNMKLFNNLKNSKILDLGCGSGESLEYLYKNGASELWELIFQKNKSTKQKIDFLNLKITF